LALNSVTGSIQGSRIILNLCKQYVAEFLDNALDAIETYHWNELQKEESKALFSLDQDITLENLSILQEAKVDEVINPLNNEAKLTLMKEVGLAPTETKTIPIDSLQDKEEGSGEIIDKTELEVEEEVKRIILDMNEIIKPVEAIIDIEPLVIIRLREYEAASFLTSELSQKNVMSYSFEIFDNGIGMPKVDLRKFGKYLASSKSIELKQTRGSQGFGAPSAFSDAQNTTGKPIVAVSKNLESIYATVSEFFTTSKNEKKYLIHPTEVDSPFLHGTYIKLNYLNVKYVRGFVDTYIKETALMNPHITIIFIDPYGDEWIYRRLVSSFPREPKYAKPHPTSTNIGDLQDLLTKSENLTVSAFLQENFVRISSKTAKDIITHTERDLQDKLNLLNLGNSFISKTIKKTDEIFFLRFEKRVFGRSERPRDKLIIYTVQSNQLKDNYWAHIDKYNQLNKDKEKINDEIKKHNNRIEKSEIKKDIKKIEKEIDNLFSKLEKISQQKEKIKEELAKVFENANDGILEIKKVKNREDFENLVNEILISKAKPSELTNEQFNSLFHSFKSMKYMSPPTDTAIPVGDTVLENTLIKEIGLKISENIDDFGENVDILTKSSEILQEEGKKAMIKEDQTKKLENLAQIQISIDEIKNYNSKILASIDINDQSTDLEQSLKIVESNLNSAENVKKDSYQEILEYFTQNYTKDDDFVSAETRPPTSGKGLAYVVEAALAYCNDPKKLETPKRSRDVLSRFVNRTPKLRDSADCAITKAVQSVNWKNYKLEIYDNNLPKGPIKLMVNVSGPYVHLMFKSQSKNALADDEELIKEIKYCLEAIGRRLRVYLNRKDTFKKSEKRTSLIEKYIPTFINSIYTIATSGSQKYKEKFTTQQLEEMMRQAIGKKLPPKKIEFIPTPFQKVERVLPAKESPQEVVIEWDTGDEIEEPAIETEKGTIMKDEFKEEVLSIKTLKNWTVNELREYCSDHNILITKSARKTEIIKNIQDFFSMEREERIEEKKEPSLKEIKIIKEEPISQEKMLKTPVIKPLAKSSPKQEEVPLITTEKILDVLTSEGEPITSLIFKMKIKDMMDARFLQLKLKELERKGLIVVETKKGKKHWSLA
jgi:DNA topoisomerase VI B subunit